VSDTEGGAAQNVEMENGSFSRKNKDGTRWGVKLKDAVNHVEKMWPTPTVVMIPSKRGAESRGPRGPNLAERMVEVELSGSLNPTWVEWLMGYPPGWTDCEDLETPLSHKSHSKS
jgi:hypothetical protein